MADSYWHKQTDKPLFPDLLWSRPENKAQAGRLLIIGGSQFGFNNIAQLYRHALRAGIGEVRVALPSSLKHVVGSGVPDARFVASSKLGGLQIAAIDELQEFAEWSNAVLIGGDLGKNPQTVELINTLMQKTERPFVLTQDGADLALNEPHQYVSSDKVLLHLSLEQLQRWAKAAHTETAITSDMNLVQLIDWLHNFSNDNKAAIAISTDHQVVVAYRGQISTTKTEMGNLEVGSHIAVFWAQNPAQVFEAATSAVYNKTNG